MVKEAFKEFSKPAPAVDAVIFRVVDGEVTNNRGVPRKSMQVLLVREKGTNGLWHLPGTMIRLGETSFNAIDRIVKDKAHINDIYFEQLYTVDNRPDRDERGHIISIVYMGIAKDNQDIVLDDNSKYESAWFWLNLGLATDKNGNRRMAMDIGDNVEPVVISELEYDHSLIIEDAIERLNGKLMYTDIGFKFMQEQFTFKELENTFCAILNTSNIPGFRRLLQDKVEPTGEKIDGKAFRPAELFKQKKN